MIYNKLNKALCCALVSLCISLHSSAWGPTGHTIVGQIAMHFLKDDVKKYIQQYLGTMTIDQVANWMDSMRSNPDYDYQKPWHYIDFAKGKAYVPSTEENIVNRLIITFNELRHKKTLGDAQVKTDLLVLFHLMGDLHQPLHTAYDDDLGGNKQPVQYLATKTNLHRFWDENIIEDEKISFEDCLRLYLLNNPEQVDSIKGIHFVSWMNESRSLLSSVYDFAGFEPDKQYVEKSKLIIERQLLIAGIRLAAILDKLFYTPAPVINTAALTLQYKNGIDASDAIHHVGKKVTVCSRVFGVRSTDKISLLNLGARFPNSPLTVVIFAKDRKNFKGTIDELFADKNICVTGKIVARDGKAEIIVEKGEEIIIQ